MVRRRRRTGVCHFSTLPLSKPNTPMSEPRLRDTLSAMPRISDPLPPPMMPPGVVPDASSESEVGISRHVVNPETPRRDAVSLSEELVVAPAEEKARGDAVHVPIATQEISNACVKGNVESEASLARASRSEEGGDSQPAIEMKLPEPASMKDTLLVSLLEAGNASRAPSPPVRTAMCTDSCERSGQSSDRPTVDVYLLDNGELRVEDDRTGGTAVHASNFVDLEDEIQKAVWSAYMTGLHVGRGYAAPDTRWLGWPMWTPPTSVMLADSAAYLDRMIALSQKQRYEAKRKERCEKPPSETPSPKRSMKETRPPPHDDRTCMNCETNETPFWRKDRKTGKPLCNACGLYCSKNGAHRPASLWTRHFP